MKNKSINQKSSVRNSYAILLLLLLPSVVLAQKVKWENDTIYKDGEPYALLIKSKGIQPTFSLRTLADSEIAVAKNDESVPVNPTTKMGYYRVTFTGSGQISHFPATQPIGKRLAEAIVESDVVGSDAVNPEGENRFVALYPSQIKEQGNVTINIGTTTSYNMVERNRTRPVSESNGTISQDNVVIGNCTSVTSTKSGKVYTTITYTLADGTKCAEATFEGSTAMTCTILTFKDGRTHSFTLKFSTRKEQEVAEYLVNNQYL